ncbi:MAG: hypothetical protein KKB50_17605 [Planctomycetes bacterium]|nr:hypothetical protein [Planctomycetota bacterium]
MESESPGIVGRIGERVISWVIFGLLIALGIAIWRMDPATRGAIASGIWRTASWLVIAAAIPWSARFFIRPILAARTNWAGAGLLVGLLALDLLAAALLMTGWPAGGWGWLGALAVLASAGTYNYLVTEYLSDQFGG